MFIQFILMISVIQQFIMSSGLRSKDKILIETYQETYYRHISIDKTEPLFEESQAEYHNTNMCSLYNEESFINTSANTSYEINNHIMIQDTCKLLYSPIIDTEEVTNKFISTNQIANYKTNKETNEFGVIDKVFDLFSSNLISYDNPKYLNNRYDEEVPNLTACLQDISLPNRENNVQQSLQNELLIDNNVIKVNEMCKEEISYDHVPIYKTLGSEFCVQRSQNQDFSNKSQISEFDFDANTMKQMINILSNSYDKDNNAKSIEINNTAYHHNDTDYTNKQEHREMKNLYNKRCNILSISDFILEPGYDHNPRAVFKGDKKQGNCIDLMSHNIANTYMHSNVDSTSSYCSLTNTQDLLQHRTSIDKRTIYMSIRKGSDTKSSNIQQGHSKLDNIYKANDQKNTLQIGTKGSTYTAFTSIPQSSCQVKHKKTRNHGNNSIINLKRKSNQQNEYLESQRKRSKDSAGSYNDKKQALEVPQNIYNASENSIGIQIYSTFYTNMGYKLKDSLLANPTLHNVYGNLIKKLKSLGCKHIYELCNFFKDILHDKKIIISECIHEIECITKMKDDAKTHVIISGSRDVDFKNIKNHIDSRIIEGLNIETTVYPDKSVTQFNLADLDKYKQEYFEFIVNTCLEKKEMKEPLSLKDDLWGIHKYMAEFYFYIMWKLNKIANYQSTTVESDIIIIKHLNEEKNILHDIITKYDVIRKKEIDIENLEHDLIYDIQIFRKEILEFLENVLPENLETIFYYCALNARHNEVKPLSLTAEAKEKNLKKIVKAPCRIIISESYFYRTDTNILCERQNSQNMMLIYTFTSDMNNCNIDKLRRIKKHICSAKQNLSSIMHYYFFKRSTFQRNLIINVLNICKFLKHVRNLDESNEKVLLVYTHVAMNCLIYVDTSNCSSYQLRILRHSNTIFFYCEYIRSLMW